MRVWSRVQKKWNWGQRSVDGGILLIHWTITFHPRFQGRCIFYLLSTQLKPEQSVPSSLHVLIIVMSCGFSVSAVFDDWNIKWKCHNTKHQYLHYQNDISAYIIEINTLLVLNISSYQIFLSDLNGYYNLLHSMHTHWYDSCSTPRSCQLDNVKKR